MRSVFVRMRERRLEAPAWAGGLKYEDTSRPQSARTHKEHMGGASSTPSHGRISSAIASGMQTRMAMTPRTDSQVNSQTPGRNSADRIEFSGGVGYRQSSGRPSTSGADITRGDRRVDHAKKLQRPSTAEAKSPRRVPSSEGPPDSRERRKGIHLAHGQLGTLTDTGGPGKGGKYQALLGFKKTGPKFYTLTVRIIGIKGMANALMEGRDPNSRQPLNPELEIMHVVMVLNVEGITHHSKPIRMQNYLSTMVPDEIFEFELQGNVLGTLLSLKVYKMLRHDASSAHNVHKEGFPEVGAAYMELASCMHSGGHRIAVAKLSNDSFVGSVGEAQIDLRLHKRPLDFTFSYTGDTPVFRKAGYTITPSGVQTMPQQYRIRGLPHGESIRTLQVEKFVAEEVPGFQVWRAKCHKGHSYTVKRFSLTEFDPRRMFVNEMDGLIDCPEHQAITPLDAFLERLEIVLVLDNMDGKYLREVVEKKGKLPEQNASIVLRQVLQAVRYLHESKLRVHNDIDARNVLVLKSGEVRLGGFCYSTRNVGASQKFAGPYVHMSPERLLGLDCGFASDSWSIGIMAMEILLGRSPYDMESFQGPNALFEFKQQVVTEPSPAIKRGDDYSDEVRLFVDSCLHKNLKLRLSIAGLLSHPFITKFESFMPNFLGRWISRDTSKRRTSLHDQDDSRRGNNIFSMLAQATEAGADD